MGYALIDGNSMYVACETVHQPQYRRVPCVVLSNNDGAVVAANRLAVELGIRKYEAYFKQKAKIELHKVKVFSSNYAEYFSLSQKMMGVISSFSQRNHIYSIDEMYLDLAGHVEAMSDVRQFGLNIRKEVWRCCRIPVSFGYANTLTLSKVANKLAKSKPEYSGVYVIDTEQQRVESLKKTLIKDVWGIGKKLSTQMKYLGIATAWDFASRPVTEIQRNFNVNVERCHRELNNERCLNWDDCRDDKQTIMSTRSVGKRITDIDSLKQALSFHANIVARKCREQKSSCRTLMTFASSSPYDSNPKSFKRIHTFEHATNDSTRITKAVTDIAEQCFQSDVPYYKVGVAALELVSDRQRQVDLFAEPGVPALMDVLDALNNRYGRGSVFLGAQGTNEKQEWEMKREFLSPCFTTRVADFPVIQC